jgi:MoaA/NifB/PqqE/SkfB family radical SAM enzyme
MEFIYYSRQWPGSSWKRLKRFHHILFLEIKRIISGRKYLAEFDLSDECNLRCKHCYHFRAKKEHHYEKIPLDQWIAKYRELYKKGVRRILLIGGEPAMRIDVIEAASRIFTYIDICSNGTIKIPDFYSQKIFVSIDGDESMHDSIRGEGVYKKILANYRNDQRVVISMTVTNENYSTIEDVIKLAIDNKMIGVSCDLYTPAPGNAENDPMVIVSETRRKIIAELKRLKKIYPSHLLMSDKSIAWYENPDHKDKPCYWRSATIHFNTQLQEKPACDYYDCSNCGHFAGANLSPLNFLLFRSSFSAKEELQNTSCCN